MELEVRAEVPSDAAEVRAVVAAAFDDETVAVLWEELAARPGAASYVAVMGGPAMDGAVVGHVGLSRAWIDGRDRLVGATVLSPLSVLPEYQQRGVGKALVGAA